MTIPKRRLTELLVLYRLQPKVRDVFVEGPTDRAVLDFVLAEARPFGTSVWWIDDLDLDVDGLVGEGGAKGRVTRLAEFASAGGITNIIGVVDRNLDPPTPLNGRKSLHPTVYPDIEFHICGGAEVEQVIELACGKSLPKGAVAAAAHCACMKYATRRLALDNGTDLELPETRKSIKLQNGGVALDIEGYLSRVISKNSAQKAHVPSADAVSAYVDVASGADIFMFVQFHDFEACLEAVLREHKWSVLGLFTVDWLGRMVRASIVSLRSFDEFFVQVLLSVNSDTV